MKNIIYYILVSCAILFLAGCQGKQETLPNIVLFFVDDQGYADLGCYGAKGFETPNIDGLAAEGIRFTDFCVSEAVCSASRSSLLTGCYAQRIGIRGALSPTSLKGLNPNEQTIASLLKGKGYATKIIGKWHLGSDPGFSPLNYGFDEYYGLLYSNDMWPVNYDGKPLTKGFRALYPPLYLMQDTIPIREIKTLEDQAELTTLYTEQAIDFIERNKNHPFFLYIPHSMVHVPLAVSDKFKGKSEQGMYGDAMMEIDWSVGEVEKKLKELGLEEHTLFIYTSDNGPWLNFGNHAGSAYPLREGKGTDWEGGVRVPCIIKWPDKVEKGMVTDEFMTTMDLLPTIAAITQSSPAGNKIDGLNMLPFLTGEVSQSPRDQFYYYYEGKLCGVRQDDWKLVLPHHYRSYEGVEPGMDGWPGPYSRGIAGLELYNLKEDVSELNNVVNQYPEIVDSLLNLANKARNDLGDDIKNVKGKKNRPAGVVGKTDTIQHTGVGKSIQLLTSYNPKYSGHGAKTLIDGVLGTYDFTDENWLGFRNNDLHAIIDLGQSTDVNEVIIDCLQNQISWIFIPSTIQIKISEDGKTYKPVYQVDLNSQDQDFQILKKEFTCPVNQKTRYLKVQVESIGNCPEWHPGRDEQGWLFIDEIIIN